MHGSYIFIYLFAVYTLTVQSFYDKCKLGKKNKKTIKLIWYAIKAAVVNDSLKTLSNNKT